LFASVPDAAVWYDDSRNRTGRTSETGHGRRRPEPKGLARMIIDIASHVYPMPVYDRVKRIAPRLRLHGHAHRQHPAALRLRRSLSPDGRGRRVRPDRFAVQSPDRGIHHTRAGRRNRARRQRLHGRSGLAPQGPVPRLRGLRFAARHGHGDDRTPPCRGPVGRLRRADIHRRGRAPHGRPGIRSAVRSHEGLRPADLAASDAHARNARFRRRTGVPVRPLAGPGLALCDGGDHDPAGAGRACSSATWASRSSPTTWAE